jgi:hypothetical protein
MNEEYVGNTEQNASDTRIASTSRKPLTPAREARKRTTRERVERLKEAVRHAREVLSRHHQSAATVL